MIREIHFVNVTYLVSVTFCNNNKYWIHFLTYATMSNKYKIKIHFLKNNRFYPLFPFSYLVKVRLKLIYH